MADVKIGKIDLQKLRVLFQNLREIHKVFRAGSGLFIVIEQ